MAPTAAFLLLGVPLFERVSLLPDVLDVAVHACDVCSQALDVFSQLLDPDGRVVPTLSERRVHDVVFVICPILADQVVGALHEERDHAVGDDVFVQEISEDVVCPPFHGINNLRGKGVVMLEGGKNCIGVPDGEGCGELNFRDHISWSHTTGNEVHHSHAAGPRVKVMNKIFPLVQEEKVEPVCDKVGHLGFDVVGLGQNKIHVLFDEAKQRCFVFCFVLIYDCLLPV